ncbi:hypothetical protein PX699_08440 [Sphingobium sp. H39-3-25]|uniref:hypothetical protein n=1 Tax=Sphingobium arseniciresistens TaxID=3030834 RepID=UPI0023B8D77E|nr:hypothetical protein [Sphingobium arseniciresistens]
MPVDRGWFDPPYGRLHFRTGGNGSSVISARPSLMQRESIALADGRIGRISTTC